jgi:hypothetical protein
VLRNHIYPGVEPAAAEGIPLSEVLVVFDADMCAKRHFYLKIMEVGGWGLGGATHAACPPGSVKVQVSLRNGGRPQ